MRNGMIRKLTSGRERLAARRRPFGAEALQSAPANTKIKAGAAAIVLLMWALSSAVQVGDFTYTTSAGTVTITGYTGAGGAVVIPDTIEGLPVKAIDTGAFGGQTNLTSLTIPDSLTTIGDSAFRGCTSLATVTIPDNVITIGDYAFTFCSGLTSMSIGDDVSEIGTGAFSSCASLADVVIGNSVTTIGSYAFYRCSSLSSVAIGSGVTTIVGNPFGGCTNLINIPVAATNPNFSSVDGVLFDKAQTRLIVYPAGNAGGYTIPEGVTSIEIWAFTNTSLTSVTIPDGVTSIGDGAFWYCPTLTSVTTGNGVISIENLAFRGCTSLTSVYFRGNAPSFDGEAVFSIADNAIVYYLPGTTGWETTFAGRPTVLWNPIPQITAPANPFGFTITGSSNLVIVVEAATSLTSPDWAPVSTNTLTDGSFPFSDPQSANHPARFYRLRSP